MFPLRSARGHVVLWTCVVSLVFAAWHTSQAQSGPSINCPTDMVLAPDPGTCARTNVTFAVTTDPGATLVCNPPSGSTFPSGTTVVTCTATDDFGGSNSCSFTVTISAAAGAVVLMGIDAEDGGPNGHGPIATWQTLVSNILSQASSGSGILVIGGGKSSIDNVTKFWNAVGTGVLQTITYVNGSNNIARVAFSNYRMIGVVSDSLDTPSGGLTAAENNALRNRAADIASFLNSGRALLGFSSVFTAPPPAAGPYAYMAGVAGVTLVRQDFNNIDPTTDGLAIGVNDTLDVSYWHQYFASYPSFLKVLAYVSGTGNAAALGGTHIAIPITCPTPVSVPCPTTLSLTGQVFNAGCSVLTVTWMVDGVAVQTNLVPATTQSASVVLTSSYGSGNHTVTLIASDGVRAPSCNTSVNVGTIPLTIFCPGNLVTSTSPGQCGAVVSYNVTASKDCVAVTNVVCNPPSGYVFPKGITTVTCTADDGAGHTTNCSFTVTVLDSQPPTLTCPANIVTNPPAGIFQVPVNFATPVATDNCPGPSVVCSPASGSMFGDGTTIVSCKATDTAGNTNLCTFTVTVNTTNATVTPLTPQTRCQGDTAIFSTTPSGPGPFNYGWRLDGNPIGTNGPTLALATGSLTIGAHPVQVTMTNGNVVVTSTTTLTVGSPTTASALVSLTRCVCETASFATMPTGTGPFAFTWMKDGQLLPNQSGSGLTMQSLKQASAGTYAVIVTGPCNSVTNSATLTIEGSDNPPSPLVLTNESYVTINDFGPATPYPSVINVKCIAGTIRKLTVTLFTLTHTFPGDIDMLLVGPNGQAIKLMSDAGNYFAAEDATLTFDDDAAEYLPPGSAIESGTFKPTDYEEFDSFATPAPSGPYTNRLAGFIGTGLSGDWSLYVMDDSTLDAGSIGHGWSLHFDWDLSRPQLSSPIKLADGRYQFTLTGETNRTHVVQRSTNLVNWTAISTNTLTNASVVLVDPQSTNASPGYYRAICCP